MTNEEIMAVVKPVIGSQLKCPASAQFPIDLISIVGDDFRGYQINGFVDSQNSYGAMIRNDFTATVVIQNGFPMVVNSSVGTKAAVNNAKQFGISYLIITLFTIIGGALMYFLISKSVGL